MDKVSYQYDVFISHAVDDKIPIANELTNALKAKGLNVWYSSNGLAVGDKVIESIHTTLDNCRFGVVIFSPTYLSRLWALNEFFFLLKREEGGQKVILPVLYDITPEELGSRFPLMADIFAVRASHGIEYVTDVLFQEIESRLKNEGEQKIVEYPRWSPKIIRNLILVFMIIALTAFIGLYYAYRSPAQAFIEQAVQQHIHTVQQKADQELQQTIQITQAKKVGSTTIQLLYTEFVNTKSYYRNEYILNTGQQIIHSRKNVAGALLQDVESITPLNHFNLAASVVYESTTGLVQHERAYTVYSKQPVTYHIAKSTTEGDGYAVTVAYTNNVRLIHTSLIFPVSARDTKRYQITLTALLPVETFHFTRNGDEWILKGIE